jgi:hypothetical protein
MEEYTWNSYNLLLLVFQTAVRVYIADKKTAPQFAKQSTAMGPLRFFGKH